MQVNNKELKELLHDNGAALVGYADLTGFVDDDLCSGISIAVVLPRDIVRSISDGPNKGYFDEYHSLNAKLNSLANMAAEYLRECGFKAFAQTTDAVIEDASYRTRMPHKTVAVQSGLGWIGKSALFVTKQFGSAIRITSVLTDAKLDFGRPTKKSKCGACMICSKACPGKAISGIPWNPGMERDDFFNPIACRATARELAAKNIKEEITLCGKCIEVCPYTRRYTAGRKI